MTTELLDRPTVPELDEDPPEKIAHIWCEPCRLARCGKRRPSGDFTPARDNAPRCVECAHHKRCPCHECGRRIFPPS